MPHNLGSERRFSFADSYMTQTPNAPLEKVESMVIFKTTEMQDWLISQPENKRKEHIKIARTSTRGRFHHTGKHILAFKIESPKNSR